MKNFLKNKMLKRTLLGLSLAIVMTAGVFVYKAMAVIPVTPATGGTNISIDTTSFAGGAHTGTALGNIIIQEGTIGDIAVGVHTLTIPDGWNFTDDYVTLAVGGATDLTVGNVSINSTDGTTLSFNITHASTAGVATLTFSGIKVHPTGETPPSTGNITMTAGTITGVNEGSTTNFGTLTAIPGAVSKIDYQTQPSAAVVAGVALATQPVVVSQDQFGNPRLTDANTITLSAYTNDICTVVAGGTFDGTNTELESSGVADFATNGVNYKTAETIYLKASDGARTKCSNAIVVTPSLAALLEYTNGGRQPAITGAETVDGAITTQPIIHVIDAYGNNVADGTIVTASIATGSGAITTTGTTTASTVSGLATFAGLGYTKLDAFQYKFTANSINSADSASIGPILVGAKHQLAWGTQPATPVLSNATWNAFTVEIQDQYGNKTADVDSITLAPSSNAFTGSNPVSAIAGTATFSDIIRTAAGTLTLVASATGLDSTPASNEVTVTPGAISSFTVTGIANPVIAAASSSPVVTALDASGNVKTDYVGIVHFASNDGSAVLPANYTFQVGDNGIHTFSAGGGEVTLKTAGAGKTVTVNDTLTVGATGTQTVTVNPAVATSITINTQPANTNDDGSVDDPLHQQPIVTVRDAYGNTVAAGVQVWAVGTDGSGSEDFRNRATTTDESGVATFADLGYSRSGQSFKMLFSVGNVIGPTSNSVTALTAGAATRIHFTTSPSTPSTAGTAFATQPVITSQDVYGNTSSTTDDVALTAFTNNSCTDVATGTLSGTANMNEVAGVADFIGKGVNYSKTETIYLKAVSFAGSDCSAAVVINPGAIGSFTVTGIADPIVAGASSSPVVTALDASGNVKTDYVGTVTFTSNDGSAVKPTPYTFLVGDNGVHTFNAGGGEVVLKTVGERTFTATDGGVNGTQAAITVTPGLAALLEYTNGGQQPISAGGNTVDGAINTQPMIHVVDAYGNNVANGTIVTVSMGSTGAGAITTAGTLATSTVSGIAAFAGLGYTKLDAFTYKFTTNGVNSVDSNLITAIAAGAADNLTIDGQPAGTNSVDVALTTQPIVHVTDQYGNNVIDATTVTATKVDGAGALIGTTTADTAGGAGLATFATLGYDTSGATFTMKFSANGHDSATSSSVGPLVPGAAATLTFGVQPVNTDGTVDNALQTPPQIYVVDQYDNPVADDTVVTAVLVDGTGTLRNATSTTAGGTATFSNLGYSKSGEVFSAQFTSNEKTTGDSNSVTALLAGLPITLTIGQQPAGVQAVTDPLTTQPIVNAVDQFGNNVGDGVTITASLVTPVSNPGTLRTFTKAIAGGGGNATFAGLGYSKAGEAFTLKFSANGHDSATLGSIGPLAPGAATHINLAASSTSLNVGSASTLTASIQDVYHNVVTTDNSTVVRFNQDGHSTYSPHSLAATAGIATTTLTDTTAEDVTIDITSTPVLTPANEVTVTFGAIGDVIPILTLNGTSIVNAYTATAADTRFSSGLQFTVANESTVTVNGTSVAHGGGVVTAAGNIDAKTLGAHAYNIIVTSSTGNVVELDVSYQVNADDVTPVTPTITLIGTTTVSAYTATEAATRFGSGLQFTTVNATSTTVNGTVVTSATTLTAVSSGDAQTLGAHTYNVIVTSTTGHTSNMTIFYQVNADSPTEPTEISSSARLVKRIATKNGVYADGWKWILDVTLPTASTTLQMSFDNLTGAGTILASSSIRFYSAQFTGHTATSTAISVVSPGAGTAWSDAITLTGDTSSNPGRQIEITVEAAVPSNSPDGYYSAAYDLR